jgi:small subunit ribosomal protein S6
VNSYEITIILRNKDLDETKKKLSEILAKHNITITKDESWGQKKLAYEIDGEREGYYFFAYADAAPESAQSVLHDLHLQPNVLRHLFVKLNKKSA